jgi:hypothetical protein
MMRGEAGDLQSYRQLARVAHQLDGLPGGPFRA